MNDSVARHDRFATTQTLTRVVAALAPSVDDDDDGGQSIIEPLHYCRSSHAGRRSASISTRLCRAHGVLKFKTIFVNAFYLQKASAHTHTGYETQTSTPHSQMGEGN